MFDTENSVYEWAWYAKHRVKGNIRLDSGRYGSSAPLPLPKVATKVLKKRRYSRMASHRSLSAHACLRREGKRRRTY